jgi:hypothetical protein
VARSPTAAQEPAEGALLVRLPARDRSWAARLPAVPDGWTLTVTVGHPDLLPVPVDDLVSGGYRIVGVAADHRPVGRSIDVYVPPELRDQHPGWWTDLLERAERVFDLRMGPVRMVLASELDLHLRPAR